MPKHSCQIFLAICVVLISLTFSQTSTANSTCKSTKLNCQARAYSNYYKKQLLKMGKRVQRDEPFLPKTEFTTDFAELQEWVHRHERFVSRNQFALQRVFIQPFNSVQIERDAAPIFDKLYQTYTNFLSEFPYNVDIHLGMIIDKDYHDEFKGKLITAFGELLYSMAMGLDDELPYFNSKACDYFSQPLNALWFSIHSMLLIDQMFSDLKPNEWQAYKEKNGYVIDQSQIESSIENLVLMVHGIEF